MAQKFLVTRAIEITAREVDKPGGYGGGFRHLSIDPGNAICDRNNRLLAFKDSSGLRYVLAPKKTAQYNALVFVEKAASVFAVGWAFAAFKNQARNTLGAEKTMEIMGNNASQVDKLLDGINRFIGVADLAYYYPDQSWLGPILEGPLTI